MALELLVVGVQVNNADDYQDVMPASMQGKKCRLLNEGGGPLRLVISDTAPAANTLNYIPLNSSCGWPDILNFDASSKVYARGKANLIFAEVK